MYDIGPGSFQSLQSPVFYQEGDTQIFTFRFKELRFIINNLLDRRDRNGGLGRNLLNDVRRNGRSEHRFAHSNSSRGFYCRAQGDGNYSVYLLGDDLQELVWRLNRHRNQSKSIDISRSARAERRRLKSLGLWQWRESVKLARPLAGANSALRRHFKNTDITFSDAVTVIARAARMEPMRVQSRLRVSLDERGVASLRLKGGFVFRVDVLGYNGLLDLTGRVELRTTNDNMHGAYRRLRTGLRKHLNRERKARIAEREQYRQFRLAQRTTRVLIA